MRCFAKHCSRLERLLEIYQEDIGPRAAVVPEVQRWVNKWKKEDVSTVPSSAIEALCACHADIYPNVYILLTVLGTLPVSTATSERSFSAMRRLKTYLRSSIGNERMTGLALLSIHKDRQIDRAKTMIDFVASRGVTRLDGARDQKQIRRPPGRTGTPVVEVCRPYSQIWVLSKANLLY